MFVVQFKQFQYNKLNSCFDKFYNMREREKGDQDREREKKERK